MSALPNRDRRAERREATRLEIVEAAWEVAHDEGLASITLRAVAERVGMRSPSLYTHFESKSAIYDAMFEQAWAGYLAIIDELEAQIPAAPRKAILFMLQTFVDYCLADLPRFQLMNQRVVADFAPSAEAYAPSLRVYEDFIERMRRIGVTRREDVDLCAALVGGLIDGQFANEPGGTRYVGQLPRVIDMYADEIGLPGPRLGRKK